ncbi:MAG TPA: histidine phosphatase family protein [Solirubrobacteraceae bacterium]
MTEHRQLRYAAPPGAATLLLVRHGESAPFREDEPPPLLGGASDPELDPVGVEQADRVAARLGSEEIAAIYVTPLRRTAQTAAPLASRLGLEPRVEPDLREVFLGEWEGGLYRKHVREQHPIALRLRREGRWDVIPGAERSEAFAGRVRAGIARIAAAHADERVVVVVHGGVIGQALALATGGRPLAFAWADNGSISELVVLDEHWTVRSYNDTAHL